MRRLASAVCVVTTIDGDRRVGLTATAVSSLCADPPSVVVCVNRGAEAYPALLASGRLGISILAEAQAEVALRFSGALGHRGEEKFVDGDWRMDRGGAPLLSDAAVVLECGVVKVMDHGTHTIFICDVRRASVTPALPPLIYLDRQFLRTGPLDAQV
jgi:flavin reductase (DIM6/NTAB) family NADH-FMN oxidoreductase RutF